MLNINYLPRTILFFTIAIAATYKLSVLNNVIIRFHFYALKPEFKYFYR